jgi:single-stranded DNA-binding protein
MDNKNEVVLTGTYRTIKVSETFEKQVISFNSKDREGQWKTGDFEAYVKPDVIQQSGVQVGDQVRVKGFLVFNFYNKPDGTQMSFPKLIVNEIQEVEKAGQAQGQAQGAAFAQPTQPAGYAATTPPVPGAAPTAPMAPQPGQAPGMPMAPQPMQ